MHGDGGARPLRRSGASGNATSDAPFPALDESRLARACRELENRTLDEEIQLMESERSHFERDHEVYRRLRRSVLHAVPETGPPLAAALVEFPPGGGDELMRVFLRDEIESLREALAAQDVIAGEDPRPTLRALGMDPCRQRLVELRPGSWQAGSPEGRQVLKLTPDRLVQAAAGHVPARGRCIERLLQPGREEELMHRLQQDAWAIATLYRYGVLHQGVPLLSGRHAVFAPCSWSLPGEPDLFDLLEEVGYCGREVEFRFQPTVGVGSPWQGSLRGALLFLDPDLLVLQGPDGQLEVPTDSVRDLRVVPPA